MSLISALHNASASLDVFSRAIDIEGGNVANAATPGYAALRSSIQPIGTGGPEIGSDYIILSSSGDFHADARVQAATSDASWSQGRVTALTPINGLFDITGSSGLLAAFQQFSAAFSDLGVTPNDPALRSTALIAAGSVATEFRKATSRVDQQTFQVDQDIQTTVANINSLAEVVRQANIRIRGLGQPDPGLEATRRAALEDLAGLTDITTTVSPDGSVMVLTGGQQPLVVGDQAYTLAVDTSAPPLAQVSSSGGGLSPGAYLGKLGALLEVRNNTLTSLVGGNGNTGSLNVLAKSFAIRVNALLSAGTDSQGTPGLPIYTFDATNDQNVARTIVLDPAIGSSQLALATSTSSNGNTATLTGLFQSSNPADQVNGLSIANFFSAITSSVGQQLADARDQVSVTQSSLTAATAERQRVSGVSLDQAAISITSLQRYFEANAKLVSILDTLTSTEINLIR